ncbi:hypothetical protein [Streptomyces sp. NPDC001919]
MGQLPPVVVGAGPTGAVGWGAAPEDAARLAAEDPRGLVPQLVEAARAVSARREGDLLHALRVAGLAGA